MVVHGLSKSIKFWPVAPSREINGGPMSGKRMAVIGVSARDETDRANPIASHHPMAGPCTRAAAFCLKNEDSRNNPFGVISSLPMVFVPLVFQALTNAGRLIANCR